MSESRIIEPTDIARVMPQISPFLFLDQAMIGLDSAEGSYCIRGNEPVLEGHFRHEKVFPASISIESLGQLGVLYLLKAQHPDLTHPVDAKSIFFSSCDGIRCQRICRVGDVLALEIRIQRIRAPLMQFEGRITVDGEKAVFAEQISLVFDWVR